MFALPGTYINRAVLAVFVRMIRRFSVAAAHVALDDPRDEVALLHILHRGGRR